MIYVWEMRPCPRQEVHLGTQEGSYFFKHRNRWVVCAIAVLLVNLCSGVGHTWRWYPILLLVGVGRPLFMYYCLEDEEERRDGACWTLFPVEWKLWLGYILKRAEIKLVWGLDQLGPIFWLSSWHISTMSVKVKLKNIKGTLTRDFLHAVFLNQNSSHNPLIHPPKAVSNINLNSSRYSNSKQIPRCGPPGGSYPTMWPSPGDPIPRCGPPPLFFIFYFLFLQYPILWCGPSRGIVTMNMYVRWIPRCAPPPAGSNPKVWPPPGDPILRCFPPRVSNFPLWPLPGDRRPHRGIVRIFFESLVLPLKGQSMENVCMVEQYHTGTLTFRL